MRTFKLIIYFILASNGYSSQSDDVKTILTTDAMFSELSLVEASHVNLSEGQSSVFKNVKRKFLKDILGNPLLGGAGAKNYLAFAKEDLSSISKENKIAKKSTVLLRSLHFHTHASPPIEVLT